MLMIGRLMLGKRSMGSRPRATKPRMATASAAIRMAIELRRASSVIHMLPPRLRADSLAVADQLLSLDDDELVSAEPLGDLDERALPDAGGDRPLADDTVVDDEHDRRVALIRDRLALDQDRTGMMRDDQLDARVHAGLEERVGIRDHHLDAQRARPRIEGVDDARRPRLEHALGVGVDEDARDRAETDEGDVPFLDLELHLDGRDVLEDQDAHRLGRRARLLGVDRGARVEVPRRDVAGERREDAGVVEVGLGDLEERAGAVDVGLRRSEEHTSELQSLAYLVCRLLLEKKKKMTE